MSAARSPAAKGGVWDPDDVEGRFDFRWVGAAYTSAGDIHLSVSFYHEFDSRLLLRNISSRRSHVSIWLSGFLKGYFLRQGGGRLVFIWGDFGSSCCETARVTRPSSNVLSVTIDPCSYVYGEEIVMAQGSSLWITRNVEAEDVTGAVEIDHPECDAPT